MHMQESTHISKSIQISKQANTVGIGIGKSARALDRKFTLKKESRNVSWNLDNIPALVTQRSKFEAYVPDECPFRAEQHKRESVLRSAVCSSYSHSVYIYLAMQLSVSVRKSIDTSPSRLTQGLRRHMIRHRFSLHLYHYSEEEKNETIENANKTKAKRWCFFNVRLTRRSTCYSLTRK